WNNMSPDGGDKPAGELTAAIDAQFGSFDKFREHFTTAATTIQGSGWAVLVYDQLGGNLFIEQLKDQQSVIQLGGTPVLQLDMWEHAFYLDYQNVKPDYVKAWWNSVNWADAGARFDRAVAQTKGLLLGRSVLPALNPTAPRSLAYAIRAPPSCPGRGGRARVRRGARR